VGVEQGDSLLGRLLFHASEQSLGALEARQVVGRCQRVVAFVLGAAGGARR